MVAIHLMEVRHMIMSMLSWAYSRRLGDYIYELFMVVKTGSYHLFGSWMQ